MLYWPYRHSMHIFSLAYIKEKWAHAGFQKYFQNIGWMFFARLGSMVISFIATAYIARNLGPTNYGELSYAISFVGLFSFIAALGIDQVLYRELIEHPEHRNKYMGSALALRLGAACIAIFLCIFFAVTFSPEDVSLYLIVLLCLGFIFNSFQIINYEFQARVEAKYPSLLSLYITILLNILKIVVIMMGEGVIYLALILLCESVFYALGFLYFRTRCYGNISGWSFDKGVAKKLLLDSWPLMFSTAFAIIYGRIDQIMIKNMLGATSVGLYDAAVRLSEVWYFIPGLITAALFPAIINAKNTSEHTYAKRLRKLALFLVLLSIAIALPTLLLSDYIIWIVFGQAFMEASLILQIYVWSTIAISLNSVASYYLIAENLKKMLLFTSCIGMITNVALNIYLIPRYGMAGAAFATLISYSLQFFAIFIVPKARKLILSV